MYCVCFQRRFRNVVTQEVVSSPTTTCVPCLDKRYDGDNTEARAAVRAEKRKEKLEEFEFQTKRLNCNGCCKNCPLNLTKLRKDLRKIINDEDEAERVIASILEWDHKNPLQKTYNVSSIWDKQKRLKEIAKCQLLCIFCHRFKTYVNGDNINFEYKGNPTYVTRATLRRLLRLKVRRLQGQGSNGVCPGPMGGTECPFKEDFEYFRTTINATRYDTGLSSFELLLLMYDFDHQSLAEKLAVIGKLSKKEQEEESDKCIVKCCLCHRWKTVVMNDWVSWVALRHGSDEECSEARLAGAELLERYDGEWRMNSF